MGDTILFGNPNSKNTQDIGNEFAIVMIVAMILAVIVLVVALLFKNNKTNKCMEKNHFDKFEEQSKANLQKCKDDSDYEGKTMDDITAIIKKLA